MQAWANVCRNVFLVVLGMCLSACQTTVEVEYVAPSKAGDFAEAEKQANDHFEYFVLARQHLLVTPASDTASGKDAGQKPSGGDGSPAAKPGTDKKPGSATVSPKPVAAGTKDALKNVPAGKGKPTTKEAKKTGNDQPKDGDGQTGKDQSKTAEGEKAKDTGSSPAPVLDTSLSTTQIDGKSWVAKVVPMPDGTHGFSVRGVSGFWKSTSLGVTRYQNTDLAASVSSTAENLVPKRIGQIASVAAQVITAVSAVAVSEEESKPLEPFVIEITGAAKQTGTINGNWTYIFSLEGAPPDGTVDMEKFVQGVKNKKVGYWPVLACRPAKLVLTRRSTGQRYSFSVVASSPEHIRLHPLPVSGKIELGTVCGASTTGTIASDPVANLIDDLQAAQLAIKTIKDAKNPPQGGGSTDSGKSGASDQAKPKTK